jgi:hypothetical protein
MTNWTPVRDRSGAVGVAERFAVPLKPGNSGGGNAKGLDGGDVVMMAGVLSAVMLVGST